MITSVREKRKTSPTREEEAINGNTDGYTLGESTGAENKAAPGTTRNGGKIRPIALSNRGYNSSLFQLQNDELLSKVRPDYERRMAKAEGALRKLKEIIERIPNRDAKTVCRSAQKRHSTHLILLPFLDRGS